MILWSNEKTWVDAIFGCGMMAMSSATVAMQMQWITLVCTDDGAATLIQYSSPTPTPNICTATPSSCPAPPGQRGSRSPLLTISLQPCSICRAPRETEGEGLDMPAQMLCKGGKESGGREGEEHRPPRGRAHNREEMVAEMEHWLADVSASSDQNWPPIGSGVFCIRF